MPVGHHLPVGRISSVPLVYTLAVNLEGKPPLKVSWRSVSGALAKAVTYLIAAIVLICGTQSGCGLLFEQTPESRAAEIYDGLRSGA